jgi:hypothetical protein
VKPNSRAEIREAGTCGSCDAPVTLIRNSEWPTMRVNGNRYIDSTVPDLGWGLFRCRRCHAVIEENWHPSNRADA